MAPLAGECCWPRGCPSPLARSYHSERVTSTARWLPRRTYRFTCNAFSHHFSLSTNPSIHHTRRPAKPTAGGGSSSSGASALGMDSDVSPIDHPMALLAMVLGGAAMATRIKLLAWLSTFACLSAAGNAKAGRDGELKAVVGAFM